ncbi:MAG: hypothetical protein NDI61_00335 [Bdellovibrionaceae bacterium]|nr:hypothetical protein [Pseudobdellovibrionaceae bacterium]
MDILALPEFVYRHNQVVIGSLVALTLLTGIVFLWRMINDKSEDGATHESSLDVRALEDTLKRVLSHAPVMVASAPASANERGDADTAATAALIAEREQKISELQAALAEAKTQASAAPATGGDALVSLEAQNKIRDLEARLAEYSIIEDDIADLSLYKEENQRLKAELEEIRSQGGVAAAEKAPEKTAEPAPVSAERPFEPMDKLGLDQDDDVMKQFAAAVNEQAAPKAEAVTSLPQEPDKFEISGDFDLSPSAPGGSRPVAGQAEVDELLKASEPGSSVIPDQEVLAAASEPAGAGEEDPLAGVLDTSKMLEEVASLDHNAVGEDALESALDTDKLLAEVSELSPNGANVNAASVPAAPAVAAERSPEPSLEVSNDEVPPAEDLFGEFKDDEENKG